MGMKDMLNKNTVGKLDKMYKESSKDMISQLKIIEQHCITIQQNQVEFEKYLVDIQERIKQLEK